MAKYEYWLSEEGINLLRGWARNGLTDDDIASNMNIAPSTLYEWKKRFPEFSNTLRESKQIADMAVENALYKKAIGYEYKEITKECGVITKEVIKQQSPDTTAQIFWLKNRKPNEWRDKQEVQNSGDVTFNVNIKVVE